MKKLLTTAITFAMLTSISAVAKEGGDQYSNGAENWLAGAVPPPGEYFLNYAGNWNGTLKDSSGNTVKAPNGEKIEMNATFDALRYVRVTNQTIFGANYGFAGILPIVNLGIDAAGNKGSRTGIGDITITPIILAWHTPELHYVFGLDLNLPTGSYDTSNHPGKNIGANYYSLEPVFGLTYLNQSGWEVSTKFMYNIKSKNKETNYQSGDEFHVDYLVGKHFGPFAVGVSGYYLKQVTDDKLNGIKVGTDGNRGQVFSYGPSIKYENSKHQHFILQWQHETAVENRFGGDKVWFKFITAL